MYSASLGNSFIRNLYHWIPAGENKIVIYDRSSGRDFNGRFYVHIRYRQIGTNALWRKQKRNIKLGG